MNHGLVRQIGEHALGGSIQVCLLPRLERLLQCRCSRPKLGRHDELLEVIIAEVAMHACLALLQANVWLGAEQSSPVLLSNRCSRCMFGQNAQHCFCFRCVELELDAITRRGRRALRLNQRNCEKRDEREEESRAAHKSSVTLDGYSGK